MSCWYLALLTSACIHVMNRYCGGYRTTLLVSSFARHQECMQYNTLMCACVPVMKACTKGILHAKQNIASIYTYNVHVHVYTCMHTCAHVHAMRLFHHQASYTTMFRSGLSLVEDGAHERPGNHAFITCTRHTLSLTLQPTCTCTCTPRVGLEPMTLYSLDRALYH